MGDRIMIVGPDGRRNYVQGVHCTTDNLRMVYNMPGDLFLEAALPDGASELIFAERGRFAGLSAGVEYLVRGSAASGNGGRGGGGGGSAVAQSRAAQAQRAVAFKDVPVTAPSPRDAAPWEAVAQAAAATPWDPVPAPAPQPQQRAPQSQQRVPRQKQPPGNYAPSSAEVEAILARTGGPLGGGGGGGVRGPGSTGPLQMGGSAPGGAYGSGGGGRQELPMGPGIDGPGRGDLLSVGDFQFAAGAASGAGAETRPRSRGGFCAREGIMPVSRGLRDAPFQGGGGGGGGGGAAAAGGRFDAGATDFTGTHTQTQAAGTGGIVPGM